MEKTVPILIFVKKNNYYVFPQVFKTCGFVDFTDFLEYGSFSYCFIKFFIRQDRIICRYTIFWKGENWNY